MLTLDLLWLVNALRHLVDRWRVNLVWPAVVISVRDVLE
jgi:hypothetical protein